jgi:hypothetical protein
MSEAKQTTDHDKIRRWVEQRGGHPATVAGTARKGEGAGLLRIDFDPPDEKLKRIAWEEFFEKFDREGLVFLHQDKTAEGKTSRFHKFVERETADQRR